MIYMNSPLVKGAVIGLVGAGVACTGLMLKANGFFSDTNSNIAKIAMCGMIVGGAGLALGGAAKAMGVY